MNRKMLKLDITWTFYLNYLLKLSIKVCYIFEKLQKYFWLIMQQYPQTKNPTIRTSSQSRYHLANNNLLKSTK